MNGMSVNEIMAKIIMRMKNNINNNDNIMMMKPKIAY